MKWRCIKSFLPVRGAWYLLRIYSDADPNGFVFYETELCDEDGKFNCCWLDDHNWVTHFIKIEPEEFEE